MYYVYLDSPCGTELIGQAENLTKAKEIKAKKDKTWQRGNMWNTRITQTKEKESNFWD